MKGFLSICLLTLVAAPLRALEAARVAEPYTSEGLIQHAVFSPDGISVAVTKIVGSRYMLEVLEAATDKKLITIEDAELGAFAPDGKTLLAALASQRLEKWDIPSGKRLASWNTGHAVAMAVSPDGKTALVGILFKSGLMGTVKTSLQAWDMEKGVKLADWGELGGVLSSVAYAPAGAKVLSQSGEFKGKTFIQHLNIWDAAAAPPKPKEWPLGDANMAVSAVLSPDGGRLLLNPPLKTELWDVASGGMIWSAESSAAAAAFADDGKTVCLLDHSRNIVLLDASTGARLGLAKVSDQENVFCSPNAFTQDGKSLLTSCFQSEPKKSTYRSFLTLWKVPDVSTAKLGLGEEAGKELCRQIEGAAAGAGDALNSVKEALGKGADPKVDCDITTLSEVMPSNINPISMAGMIWIKDHERHEKMTALAYAESRGNAGLLGLFKEAELRTMLPKILEAEKAGDAAAQAANSDEALSRYREALALTPRGSEPERRIREKAVKLVLATPNPPEVPEAAKHNMTRAEFFVKKAAGPEDYRKALGDIEAALKLAPWWGKAYYNLGVVKEALQDFKGASDSFSLYLAAAPDAPDAKAVKKKLVELEVDMERTKP